MTPTTNLEQIVTPQAHLASKYNFIITAILFAQEANKNQFYTGPAIKTAPTSDVAIRAEAQFNDVESDVFLSNQFRATIKALTAEDIRDFTNVGSVSWKVGMVVRPINPQYRKRSDDGYTVGQLYLVTNETSGRARGLDNFDTPYLNGTHGFGVKPMSTFNDEWELVDDQPQIEALVQALTEKMGSKFVDGLLADDGKSLFWVAEKLAK